MARDRLAMGELEARVMDTMWSADDALTPGQVNERLSPERRLAYTTVMTILTRLWNKGLLDRERRGRAFAYRPVSTKAETTARRMREILESSGDRSEALASFLGTITGAERAQLRRLLGRRSR